MSRTKDFLMQVSTEMGFDGEINDEVLEEAGRRFKSETERQKILDHIRKSTSNGMCEGCGENVATHDFLCDACDESMRIAYGDPIEYTAEELDEMERAYHEQKDAESLVDPAHPEFGKCRF